MKANAKTALRAVFEWGLLNLARRSALEARLCLRGLKLFKRWKETAADVTS